MTNIVTLRVAASEASNGIYQERVFTGINSYADAMAYYSRLLLEYADHYERMSGLVVLQVLEEDRRVRFQMKLQSIANNCNMENAPVAKPRKTKRYSPKRTLA